MNENVKNAPAPVGMEQANKEIRPKLIPPTDEEVKETLTKFAVEDLIKAILINPTSNISVKRRTAVIDDFLKTINLEVFRKSEATASGFRKGLERAREFLRYFKRSL